MSTLKFSAKIAIGYGQCRLIAVGDLGENGEVLGAIVEELTLDDIMAIPDMIVKHHGLEEFKKQAVIVDYPNEVECDVILEDGEIKIGAIECVHNLRIV